MQHLEGVGAVATAARQGVGLGGATDTRKATGGEEASGPLHFSAPFHVAAPPGGQNTTLIHTLACFMW